MLAATRARTHQPRPFSIRDILDLDSQEKTPPPTPTSPQPPAKKTCAEQNSPSTERQHPSHPRTAPPYRRHGSKFSPTQTERLEKAFAEGSHPSREQVEELGAATGLLAGQVQVWFQNRRAKERKRAAAALRLVQMQRGVLATPPMAGAINCGEKLPHQAVPATPTMFMGAHPLLVTPLSLIPGAWPLAYQLSMGATLCEGAGSSQREKSKENMDTQTSKKGTGSQRQPLEEGTNFD